MLRLGAAVPGGMAVVPGSWPIRVRISFSGLRVVGSIPFGWRSEAECSGFTVSLKGSWPGIQTCVSAVFEVLTDFLRHVSLKCE